MSMITLHNTSHPEVTILSNTFIDNYMPEANGEFVKVYIYLLRALSSAPVSFSLEQMADRLLCTERDILRALKYWAKQELLTLDFTDNNKLCGIALLSPSGTSSDTAAAEISGTSEPVSAEASAKPSSARPEALTPERVSELKQNEDIIQLLYVAEQYLGKTLSPTEVQKLLFFYDGLGMSVDLIDYLIEYCVGHNHKSIRYIEKVALAWAEEGITSVEEAKQSGSRYNKDYFSILKALGITNRNPMVFPWRSFRRHVTAPSSRPVRQVSSTLTRFLKAGSRRKSARWTTFVLWTVPTKKSVRKKSQHATPVRHRHPTTDSTISSSVNITSTNTKSTC